MRKDIFHPAAIELANDILVRIPQKEEGIYDKADPTAYSKGDYIVNLSSEQTFKLSYVNCTWGIELTILREKESQHGYLYFKKIGGFYLTLNEMRVDERWVRTDVLIPRQESKGLLKLLYLLSKQLPPVPEIEIENEPHEDYEIH